MNFTATIRDPSPPRTFSLFSLYEEELGGTGPERIPTLSGPQERVLRCHVQQIVDAVPSLPTLDDPAPQMVEQLPDTVHFFDTLTPDPEQVIEVPKILPDDVPLRTGARDTQLAEQLVEVPTIVSYSLLQLFMEQNVDIPVPGRGGRFAGLQGFPREQSSTAPLSAQIVDIPVSGGGLQGFRSGQGSSSSHSPAGVHEDLDEPRALFRHGDRSKLIHRRSSSCLTRKTPRRECGRPAWPSRRDHRNGSSCAPWSTSPTWCPSCRSSIFQCRRVDQLVEVCRHLDFHIP